MAALISPDRLASRPVDGRGFPVPWFVAWVDGTPDFRCVAPGKLEEAVRRSLCWVCGRPLGRFKTFVTGPLCAVNGVSAEPPSHRDCAEHSARACPFLSRPRMRRNDKDLPDEAPHPAGRMIDRNPGVALLWTTRSYRVLPVAGGALFSVGPPVSVQWFAEGREARRAEVVASLESGLPLLRSEAEKDGPEALAVLDRLYRQAMRWVPTEAESGGRSAAGEGLGR
ncbi:hypothetical protein [Methylobacterium oxalidis]|uniref:hypothetical protein n=1 Tax=Methylobacterium oxalidis TaxID=944322 RepID=UPI001EDF8372|nr:hypothetical protein [Methylobacterium oxalidis]GJE33189.1 hypothetical protein LDDCCGHA_3388 [Methylobacterium oxalidis]